MSFTDHKITQFAHKIAYLADQPTLPPDELKARFDACPEELRQSLNAVCDDAARLEARVEGIVVDTFGDTIDKEMLSDELAAELDGKATQSALSAEAAARESADDALDTRLTANETLTAQKCEVYCGTFTGNGQETQFINLGFTPKAVFAGNRYYGSDITCYAAMATSETPSIGSLTGDNEKTLLEIVENGFKVAYHAQSSVLYCNLNANGQTIPYLAFK